MKIYIPNDSTYSSCYVVQSSDTIRAYDVSPAYNRTYNYRDYFINSDYIYRDGSGQWSNYATLPVCLSSDVITHDFYYRRDLSDILIVFSIFFFFVILIPYKICSRAFGRWLKV